MLCAVLAIPSLTHGQEHRATVLSFSGTAAWKAASGGPWQPVTVGLRLKGDVSLKTGAGSFVRGVLTASGRPMEIPEDTEGVLDTLLASATPAQANVLAALGEVFSGATPERKLQGEAAEEGVETPAPRGRRAREEWFSPLKQERLTWEDAERLVYAAARSADRRVQNRAVALLTYVAQGFPEDAGLRALARQAAEASAAPGQLEVIGDKSEGKALENGTPLHKGDRTRVRYRADTESFPVIVRMTVNKAGAVAGRPLWKATQDAPAPIAGADRLDLPGRTGWFQVRSTEVAQAMVAWVCVAPPREDAVAAAIAAAEQQIAAGGIDPARLPAVPYCPQVIAMRFPVEWK